MKAITINHLKKDFGKVTALKEVSLEVAQGELYGLIGPDGAGKTTMIRILTSLLTATAGKVSVLGLNPQTEYKALRQKIGYMPGQFSLYQDLSVEENLNLFASIYETTIEANYHLVKDIYQQIEPFKHRRTGALSGGMKQKLALCCAMIHRPEILFLDEPTTGVDAVSRKEFWEMLKTLNAGGLTIFVSTPYMDEASLCERVALIQAGEILAVDTPENINKTFGRHLYAIKGGNKRALLNALKSFEHCQSAYSFGSSIHYTDSRQQMDVEELLLSLQAHGHSDITIEEISPSIEDSFMKLMTSHDS